MIQGLLDNVGNMNYTFINGSSVLLTWTSPYTLDNVPITGYYVVDGLVSMTNNTNITISATNPDPCILNNVSVSPINDVGIGLSNNISFYYERDHNNNSVNPTFNNYSDPETGEVTLHFTIPVLLECTSEARQNATVIIQCNETGIVFHYIYLVENTKHPNTITGSATVPQYQECNISMVLSNEAGSSEPFIRTFKIIIPVMPSISPTPSPTNGTDGTVTSIPVDIIVRTIVGCIFVLLIIIVILVIVIKVTRRRDNHPKLQPELTFGVLLEQEREQEQQEREQREQEQQEREQQEREREQREQEREQREREQWEREQREREQREQEQREQEQREREQREREQREREQREREREQQEQEQPVFMNQPTNTGAAAEGTTEEPVYSDLGTDESTRPESKVPLVQSYDVVKSASGTTVIGAAGGDTNPPAIPDNKSNGAATTGHGGAASNAPIHVNDDSHSPSPYPDPPPTQRGKEGVQSGFTDANGTTDTYL
uniref:Neurotransmitter-gated ion-channel transmembrane domain-containing protein n=1 Tax=Amphimedon queenslandica TaxID=400682 RepID=A0A1X7VPS2_AMPQE